MLYSIIAMRWGNQHFFPITLVSVLVAFVFRILAVSEHWPQIVPLDAPPQGPSAIGPV
jgi:hypothetical protein